MLIDDDADEVAIFEEALNRINPALTLLKASDGLELFKVLSAQRPDTIFLDMTMPNMGGWESLRKLKGHAAYNKIDVIIYSNSILQKDIDMAYRLGARLYIVKPERLEELSAILSLIAGGMQDEQMIELKKFACVRFPTV